jgi:hypothetical protein
MTRTVKQPTTAGTGNGIEADMQLMERVRRLFSRGSDEDREKRRIAKAQKQAATLAERGNAEGRSTVQGPGGA